MIEIKNLRKSYKTGNSELEVLKGLNLEIEEGEFVAIMGSSGSGKSTLLNVLGILDGFNSGSYLLANHEITHKLSENKAAQFRNELIGFVFQSFNLLAYKNAVENVALPLYYRKISRKERNKIATSYLEKVGLGDRLDHLPNQLSGGQKQRVAIARAMVSNPKIILADEPTGALDTQTSYEVMQIFKELNQQGMTVIIVTHENDIAQMTNRIVRLKDGVILSDERTSV